MDVTAESRSLQLPSRRLKDSAQKPHPVQPGRMVSHSALSKNYIAPALTTNLQARGITGIATLMISS